MTQRTTETLPRTKDLQGDTMKEPDDVSAMLRLRSLGWPSTRHQRCWVHKTSNVLNKVPKSIQPTVKSDLRDIWQAETRADAGAAMGVFAEKYGRKYEKAVTCLTKDREALLASTTSPRSTGTTCEPPTRSRASSPRSGIAPSGPRARCRRRQRG